MSERSTNILIILLSILAVVLICGAAALAGYLFLQRSGGAPIQAPEAAYTQAAQTIIAQATIDAGSTAVAQLTQVAQASSTSAVFPTYTLLPTVTQAVFPSPTLAWVTPTSPPNPTIIVQTVVVPPSPTTGPVTPCNRAAFVADVTIPDGTTLPPNTPFTKIWRVRNTGSCTWNSSYALVFNNGTPMTDNRTIPIPRTVYPNEEVDLGVEMRSPSAPGTYTSNWLLRDPAGYRFGVGSSGTNPIYTRIRVSAPPPVNPSFAYDFVANYCNAQWRTDVGLIGCTNPTNDSRGSVAYLQDPQLETRIENEPALWTRPNQSSNGYIAGLYPPYLVKAGDRFVVELSCLRNSTGCDVTFRLDYTLANGFSGNLGVWREVYDNRTQVVNLDLSALVGQSVQFSLRMQNNGNVSQANGIWFLPSIRNQPATSTALPPTITPTVTPTIPPTVTLTPTETSIYP